MNQDCHDAAATAARPATSPPRTAAPERERPLVLVVGNPNVGKTTLFNALTGEHARVGNYPGITVERRVGRLAVDTGPSGRLEADLVDVPGAYSLGARSAEEQIALEAVLGLRGNPKPSLAIVAVDAGQLVRNLYLVLQLLELEVPLVVALNMIDEVAEAPPSADAVARALGVPCVATSARDGQGIAELRRVVGAQLAALGAVDERASMPLSGRAPTRATAAPRVTYPEVLLPDLERVAAALPGSWRGSAGRDRALALWALTSLDETDELVGIDPALRERCRAVRAAAGERDLDHEIIGARYALLEGLAPSLYASAPASGRGTARVQRVSERLDRWLIHPIFGFVLFVLLMSGLFQALFTGADPAIRLVEGLVRWLQEAAVALLPAGLARDLLTQGVIGGVGNVVVFLPQILLLFLFIGLLEDSGYMARVAYLMDRIMRSLGLHGRAFIPMLSGFACAIPAILSTRTMERRRDRLLTMLVIPLMTCSARLPVYTLIIAALFPPTRWFGWLPMQGVLMAAMYVFSVLVSLVAAAVLGRTVVRGRRIPLLLELPPYRRPKLGTTLSMVWDRARSFLSEAGTVILACTVLLWALLSFPRVEPTSAAELGTAKAAQVQLAGSYAGRLGHVLEPALAPLGFDWKIGVGLIGAFAAREVFVSTLGIVYGIGGDDDAVAAPLRDQMRAETRPDGEPAYTPLVGLSLMVFFALACQCMSTLAVLQRETRSWRWPAFLFAYMTTLAWLTSFVVYQGGRALGF